MTAKGDRMQKPTVLIVHNRYRIPGGEDTVAENEKGLLEKNGHRVITYIRDNSELDSMNAWQKFMSLRSFAYSEKTYKDIQKLIKNEKADIVQVHNTVGLVTPSVYYAADDLGIPVIQTVHNFRLICPGALLYRDGKICEDCLGKGGLNNAVKHSCYRDSRMFTDLCVRSDMHNRAKGIYRKLNYICLTEFNRNKLIDGMGENIDPERVFIKPNFTEDIAEKAIDSAYDTQRFGKYFLYAGRLEPEKGVMTAVNLWKDEKGSGKLVIAGSGSLEDKIREAGEKCSDIIFLGQMEHKDIIKLMSGAEALIAPSHCYEGFPMNVVESFMCGTPVICEDIGNTADIVGKITPETVIRPDHSLSGIISGFDKKRYSERCRNEYLSRYTPEVNYSIFESIIGKVMEKQR